MRKLAAGAALAVVMLAGVAMPGTASAEVGTPACLGLSAAQPHVSSTAAAAVHDALVSSFDCATLC